MCVKQNDKKKKKNASKKSHGFFLHIFCIGVRTNIYQSLLIVWN